MLIRTIVVDDEYLARERIKKLLEPFSDVRIIGEGRNGEEAVDLVSLKSPDLLFLDVQMPGLNGIEVIKRMQVQQIPLPLIVFTTAYDSYALKAFESNALDYLLKPFEKERFQQMIERVRQQFNLQRSLDMNTKMMSLMKSFAAPPSNFRLQFIMKEKGREHLIPTEDIYYLIADGNYLKLHTNSRDWLYRATMNQIADELDPSDFLRIHRSIILNNRYLEGYQYLGNNEYSFRMKNGEKLVSSRSYKQTIQNYFLLNE